MMPDETELEIYQDVNFAALRQPTLEQVQDESAWWLPYHGYWPGFFGSSTFEEAAECLAWERSVIDRLPEWSERAEEELLDQLDDEDVASHLGSLDLGVASSVLALSAAGCATLVSCSGHFGEGRWTKYPMIQFAADEVRVRHLLDAAARSHCGISDSHHGLVEIWATDLQAMMEFARNVIEMGDRFVGLAPAITSAPEDDIDDPEHFVHPDQGLLFE